MALNSVQTSALLREIVRRSSRLADERLNIIVFGAPGCGKGTHSEWLMKDYSLCHISTGDALREEIASQSELGKRVDAIIAKGELVSDELVLDIVCEKINRAYKTGTCKGCIFDGFPRTLTQAKGLDALLTSRQERISNVFYFECSEEILKFRICGRLTHPASGRTYHTTMKPPKVEGIDDVTGEPLKRRPDDNEESLKTRLASFYQQTQPLITYYREQGCLNTFDSNREADEVKADIKLLVKIVR